MLTWIRRNLLAFIGIIIIIILLLVAAIFGFINLTPRHGNRSANREQTADRTTIADSLYLDYAARKRQVFVRDSLNKDAILKAQKVNCPEQSVKGNYDLPNGYTVTQKFEPPKYQRQRTTGNGNYRPKRGPSWGPQTPTQTDVPENAFTNTFKSTTTTTPAVTETRTSTEVIVPGSGNLAITVYTGGLEGAYCTSIDKQGHLIYAIKAEGVTAANASIAPELNYVGGPQFTLDQNQGWWFCIDMNRLVSVQEINSDNAAVEWGVYIGKVTSGNYTYENWLPHAWTKGTLKAARGGKEWGEITPADLIKMHAIDPNIWTESTGGTIKFFAPGDTGGKVQSPDDHNLYYGAKFHTRIYGQRISTRTIN